ncbi:hypothetical protein CN918_32560 [Priestia megaterium]|nr:hypothetical protein CN918_32560 [Priestia megaterium]
MKKRHAFLLSSLLLATSLVATPEDASAASSKGTVTSAYMLNVRSKPSNNGKIVAVLKKGMTVDILNGSGSWDYIQYGKTKGYVYDKYLKITSVGASTSSASGTGKVTKAYMLNLRQSANGNSRILAVLSKGNSFTILGKTGNWLKVSFNGKVGYIDGRYVTLNSTSTPTSPPTTTPPTANMYKVKSGDTLFGIALAHKMSLTTLKTLNQLTSNTIYVNQTLKVTGTYTPPTNPSVPTPPVTTPPTSTSKTLTGKTIVLDPGHGNVRSGAVANGILEKELNYDIAVRTKQLLELMGAKVYLTRVGDTDCRYGVVNSLDLACRAAASNKYGANIFVSIHANSGPSTAYGAETFYYNSKSISLASAIQSSYVNSTGLHSRKYQYANFAVLRGNTVPSVLLETGFITNSSEALKLKSSAFRTKAAQGIVAGIQKYFGK